MSQTEAEFQAANYRWYKACKAEDRRRFVPQEIHDPNDRYDYDRPRTTYAKPEWLACGYRSDWDYERSYENNFPEEKDKCSIA